MLAAVAGGAPAGAATATRTAAGGPPVSMGRRKPTQPLPLSNKRFPMRHRKWAGSPGCTGGGALTLEAVSGTGSQGKEPAGAPGRR